MPAQVNHIQLNVNAANLTFYREFLLGFLGWTVVSEMDRYFGATRPGGGASLWFVGYANDATNDYNGRGMNHLAFGVQAQAEVDEAVIYLRGRGIEPLFETPLHDAMPPPRQDQTYYRVMFESPDRILLEFAYSGPRS